MSETQQAEVVDEGAPTPGVVEVDTLLTHDLNHVWQVLSTNAGIAAFLGEGAVLGNKGEHWRASDGTHGVWRSYHPMEQVRLSWHAGEDAPRSMVDLHLAADGERTRVSIRHDNIDPALDPQHLHARWTDALARLDEAAEG
jgi:uncharacterized protein YndB with AHSA1/START domain